MSMAELAMGWKAAGEDETVWQARMDTAGGQLILTVWEISGLWYASVEPIYDPPANWQFAPSPLASRELAQEWAEGRAEQLQDSR